MSQFTLTRWKLPLAIGLLSVSVGCQRSEMTIPTAPEPLTAATGSLSPVVIRDPPVPQGVPTGETDQHGHPVTLRCEACHRVRPSNSLTSQTAELNEFHQGLVVDHGGLTCISCHQPDNGYATLRLADGRSLPFGESMTLCAQCHGTQFRDYQQGAHGGLTGYWDRQRGGQTRNHCLHCHNAHHPAFPVFQPAPGPRDRFAPVVQEKMSHE